MLLGADVSIKFMKHLGFCGFRNKDFSRLIRQCIELGTTIGNNLDNTSLQTPEIDFAEVAFFKQLHAQRRLQD